MWMNGVGPGGHVLQVNINYIVFLSTDHGPHETQPFWLLNLLPVGGVGVLQVHSFLVNAPNTCVCLLQVLARSSGKLRILRIEGEQLLQVSY